MLRRMTLVAVLGAVATVLLPGQAVAAPQVPHPTETIDFVAEPGTALELCPFPVRVQGTSAQQDRLEGKSGTTSIFTGAFVATFTNQNTGESVTYNVSGSTKTSGNVATLTGPAVVLLFAGAGDPGPGLVAIKGKGTIVDGLFQPDTFKGRSEDVCQRLA